MFTFSLPTVKQNSGSIRLPSPHHLYWPDLDIDLAVESIDQPEKYPLVSQAALSRRGRTAKRRRQPAKKRRPAARLRG